VVKTSLLVKKKECPITIHDVKSYTGIGVVLNLWTDALFKQHKTTVKPCENPTHLAMSGPFRVSRHPMYFGTVAILLGIAIALGPLISLVVPVLFVIVMEVIFIPFEERNLEKAFGKEYLDYKKKVRRRWIWVVPDHRCRLSIAKKAGSKILIPLDKSVVSAKQIGR